MDIGKLSYYSRKIHRWSMWFAVVLGLVQMVTGMSLKYPFLFPFLDSGTVLNLHILNATYFVIAFSAQMLTGLIMYLAPWLIKKFQKPPAPPTRLSN